MRIRLETLRRTVAHEVQAVLEGAADPDGRADLEAVLDQHLPAALPPGPPPAFQYTGRVEPDRPALFMPFPFCLEALAQVAALNLEFFNLRFVLRCRLRGALSRLFALLVHGRIAGLAYLEMLRQPFYRGLEVKYIATRPGVLEPSEDLPVYRGTGTALMAGIWMLWKEHLPEVREIVLDAEIAAAGFYRRLGFVPRRIQQFALRQPDGPLLAAIAVMADHCRPIHPRVEAEIIRLLRQAHGRLRRRRDAPQRPDAAAFVRACLLARHQSFLARTAAEGLLGAQDRIPEAADLLAEATRRGRLRIREAADHPPLLVVHDQRFQAHLQGIFHLESPLRLAAVERILAHPSLSEGWRLVPGRAATLEELAWVHTAAHIQRIADTAGQPLASLDLDTQTTARSFEVACLAAGSVFELIDAVWHADGASGFAFVRPPGHHAEPDRAMGFCLFNNVALGACYLQRIYAARRLMIVDIDAHHGNGTQTAFYDTDQVLFISLHEFPAYPGTGRLSETGRGPGLGHTVNIPLGRGSGDREVAQILHWIVRPLARAYQPEMILVSCGFDLYHRDRLSGLQVTAEGYAVFGQLLQQTAAEVCQGRVVFVLEGGYHVESVENCGLKILQALCGRGEPAASPAAWTAAHPNGILRKVMALHRTWWPCLGNP
jgi:acetoin utilization deacetylase AcuC-like enzyme